MSIKSSFLLLVWLVSLPTIPCRVINTTVTEEESKIHSFVGNQSKYTLNSCKNDYLDILDHDGFVQIGVSNSSDCKTLTNSIDENKLIAIEFKTTGTSTASPTELTFLTNLDSSATDLPNVLFHLDLYPCCALLEQKQFKLHLNKQIDVALSYYVDTAGAQNMSFQNDRCTQLSKTCQMQTFDSIVTFSYVNQEKRNHYYYAKNPTYKVFVSNFTCPSECTCAFHNFFIEEHCRNKVSRILINYPSDVRFLLWLQQNIQIIETNAFARFRNSRLEVLNVAENGVSDIKPGIFEGLQQLLLLSLDGNALTVIKAMVFKELVSLETLDLDNNQIYLLQKDWSYGLDNLRNMWLKKNHLVQLHSYTFTYLYNLLVLDMSYNMITNLEQNVFNPVKSLVNLFLNVNKLTSFDVEPTDLHFLQVLNLSSNVLNAISPTLFQDRDNMNTFDLTNNSLKLVTKRSFMHMRNNTDVYVDNYGTCCFMNDKDRCYSSKPRPAFLTCKRLLPNDILSPLMWILGLTAVVGNMFVIYCRWSSNCKSNKIQSLLISNLAVADFLMGIYMIIIASANVHFGEYFPSYADVWRNSFVCTISGMLSVLSSEASVFLITFISIDRYLGIKYPFGNRKLTTRLAIRVIFMIWCLAITVSVISGILSKIDSHFYEVSEVCIGLPMERTDLVSEEEQVVSLNIPRGHYNKTRTVAAISGNSVGMYFSLFVFIGINFICFIIVPVCYIMLAYNVRVSSKQSGRSPRAQEEIRMSIKMAAVVLTDFCCWMPIVALCVLVQSGLVTISPTMSAWTVAFILPINSAINPFLYTLSSIVSNRIQRRHQLEKSSKKTQQFGNSSTKNSGQKQGVAIKSIG